MATPKDLPQDVGTFIRDLRQTAKISLRQLADRAGVSNPYLSQIERGLRKPSAEVLQQLASALRVSTPAMYLRAGLLDGEGQQGVLAAIAVDPDLTIAQKQSLTQIYETFRNENARHAADEDAAAAADKATVPDPADGEVEVPDEEAALRAAVGAHGVTAVEDDAASTPAESLPVDDQPVDDQPADDQPAEGRPAPDPDAALKAVVEDVAVVEGGAARKPGTNSR
ncbi:helix-turn-helix domain-containing protein [Actinoplanes sp. NPDC051494]|uniref:helix-turn-helix domain-containing protein n=1 Tax=Actinoplanes sp. NPDC051494 TaxID=3363907 RepID=UPI003798C110